MNDQSLTRTKVLVKNSSAFDKSHQNILTGQVGTLIPVMVDEVIPDSHVHLRGAFLSKLPPLVSDTFMRVKLHVEAFFVPFRLLYGGFSSYMAGEKFAIQSSSPGSVVPAMPFLRPWNFEDASDGLISDQNSSAYRVWRDCLGPGSLADYLGFKQARGAAGTFKEYVNVRLNAMPFLAYHRIYDDWYRNPLIQNAVFKSLPNTGAADFGSTYDLCSWPYSTYTRADVDAAFAGGGAVTDQAATYRNTLNSSFLTDGHRVGALRQRNFGRDYFTSATPTPTVGDMPELVINTTGDTGSFTIGVLRSINALTEFAERNALAGTRYTDWLRANYGVSPRDAVLQRPRYLGRVVFDVYSKGVYQTTPGSTDQQRVHANPFDTVGAQYGDATSVGEGDLIDDFYVEEPGIIMVLASLVPKVSYTTGASRYLRHFTQDGSRADVANQIFENVGPQPIFKSELDGSVLSSTDPDAVFGYTDRYAEFKTKLDEVHGYLRDGESLESFVLQRGLGLAGANLGTSFLQIPTNYLDQILAVSTSDAGDYGFGYWLDCAFDYKVVQPLSRYSNPSLVMPAVLDGHSEEITRSGSYL